MVANNNLTFYSRHLLAITSVIKVASYGLKLLRLVPCFAYIYTLKMEAICSFETSGFLQNTRRYIKCNEALTGHEPHPS
jgi:hypothetical protein